MWKKLQSSRDTESPTAYQEELTQIAKLFHLNPWLGRDTQLVSLYICQWIVKNTHNTNSQTLSVCFCVHLQRL